MLELGEALRLVLAALALGITIPVMLQLFLTLRQVQHTVRRFDPSLRVLNNQLAERPIDPQPAVPQLVTIAAAMVPALVAAYQTFRHEQQAHAATHEGRQSPARNYEAEQQ